MFILHIYVHVIDMTENKHIISADTWWCRAEISYTTRNLVKAMFYYEIMS